MKAARVWDWFPHFLGVAALLAAAHTLTNGTAPRRFFFAFLMNRKCVKFMTMSKETGNVSSGADEPTNELRVLQKVSLLSCETCGCLVLHAPSSEVRMMVIWSTRQNINQMSMESAFSLMLGFESRIICILRTIIFFFHFPIQTMHNVCYRFLEF